MLTPFVLLALFLVATWAGAQNAVAGGGSFFTFPALIFVGVPPIEANATSTVALWPGSVSSVFGFREELRHERRTLYLLGAVSLVGGIAGAILLLSTPEKAFTILIPFLIGGATLVFAFGPAITKRLRRAPTRGGSGARVTPAFLATQLAVAIYGGYFGGGIGIMMLAAMSAMGMEDIHAMNGLKAILGSLINGAAIVVFVVRGAIDWPIALVMLVGAILGGYFGARLSKRLDPKHVRRFVIAVGSVLTVYFAAKVLGLTPSWL